MVQRFPDDPEIRLLYAIALLPFQPSDVAVEAAKAAELSPDDPVILVRAGHQLLSGGDLEGARECAVRANELVQPGFVLQAGLVSLDGRLAAINGDDKTAEEKLRRARKEDPHYSTFAIDLARFLATRNRQAEAIGVIDDALRTCKMKDGLQPLRDEILGIRLGDKKG